MTGQGLPVFWQYFWMCCSIGAVIGGALSLAILVFRTLPMMRRMLKIAEDSLALQIEGKTIDGRESVANKDLHRVANALEERLPAGGPLVPKRRPITHDPTQDL